MPISPKQNTDKNQRGYGLPTDSCVGDGVGDPYAGGSRGKTSAQKNSGLAISGGDPHAGGKSGGKARAQQKSETWIPGSGTVSDVPVGYDGP